MITVRMIQYWNDYHKKELQERFGDLEELADWIFNQMRVDYTSESGRDLLSFPKCDTNDRIYEISVRPERGGYVFWIKQIEDENSGIIFGTICCRSDNCCHSFGNASYCNISLICPYHIRAVCFSLLHTFVWQKRTTFYCGNQWIF